MIRTMPYRDPEKQKAAQRRYYDENKEKILLTQNKKRNAMRRYIQEVKESTPCADCGMQYPHYVMDFDHLPGEVKLYNISNQMNSDIGSLATLKAEIAKCEIVCANCHRHRTYMRTSGSSTRQLATGTGLNPA